MKKKILMVYPETPMTYWSFKYIMKLVGRRSAFPPLGLMTVASLLPDSFDVTLVDMNTEPLKEGAVKQADLVFVSAMMIQKESFERVVALCNRLGKTVVAGGPYPSGSYRNIAGVDHFILGEAETILPRFIEEWERGEARPVYAGETRPDITKTPPPRFDLVKHRRYTTMSLQYSRGCPFNCEFCDIIELFGRVPRTKTPSQFVAEMDALYRTGYRGPLFIVDDNFIGNRKNVKELLIDVARWQKEREYPYMITTEASVNLADDEELMDLMMDAGFNKVFLGIETPVAESLEHAGKKQNLKGSLLGAVEKIQRKGMEVTAGFIIGFDSDPENVFDLQIDFIRESGIPMAMAGLLIALPDTRLYRRLEAEGRIIKETSGNNTHTFSTNFITVMDGVQLASGYKMLISQIYTPKEYFGRCLTLMERMPRGRAGRGAYSFWTMLLVVRIFFSSVSRQVFSSYGKEYLEYLAAAMRIRPGMFPKAVKLALFGYHFFRITKEILAADDLSASIETMRRGLRNRVDRALAGRLEDIVHDLFALDREVFGKAFIAAARKKYRMLHDDFRGAIEEPMRRLAEDVRAYIEAMSLSLRKTLEARAPAADSLREMRAYCRALKLRARKKYRYLSRDFRVYFDEALELFERRVDSLLSDYEGRYRV
ncbi:MAG TPA: B12-binding domain-containing radical SAM protein [Spirochaetota bacterium]|nr:B12-binding domain-containing radical SAM protein [Spirochaetota bacterium]HPC41445.1 B12-binding domain-containing radical SAM protein [Spirochaetota bacterium]HPL19013.1 B12-binding domain-containing radical SAM protein [Spirochaetota bacterium]HQF09172.1 B12-binding domain-containing radical SAM protein [Spirochaetota bacterium]HQH97713.1 B12-binding domain-containing radical SAM protein [Spirochaetota bacterium]